MSRLGEKSQLGRKGRNPRTRDPNRKTKRRQNQEILRKWAVGC